ncbi:flagellar biosynthetic protein FliQ [Gluconobacter wancherniae]|uniref:Flagellar export apparatus protein FliQ n=1 Tax=Gluconobacter wancherniae NBRC 103581 TaxID=656744 RepID=A0A511B0Z6_9PROT|nr:flagellar biosynthetic protein FliQ [Gluconobacter wancherniae]MBF0854047.1 flagellar biosynthetic protein FliQ [Gluconobacter wancherniae]MBS1062433.1 flagellar biosynthetic protein FliQ [Gluconobacter wancherniae]MBS1095511.1 flagellar biosynthetic protein FliQ [Gluconobacter wancherniae]GBD57103.1 flagellar export apparatus protein FliQ [Gluconobacter wancherniae NBRC 103581]GBR65186.1 flagellar biosynthetic protein FliQ [Gluconobacter wancherniae NBRC 103581]
MQSVDLAAILEQTLIVALKLSAPALLTALAVGLLVSLVQAVTQINEATLAFVPKVLAISVALVVAGSFMTSTLMTFSRHLFDQMILVGAT